MTAPIEVKPSDIQKELAKLEEQNKENEQQRASLFNLIVFLTDPKGLAEIAQVVDEIASQFPCRILFIQNIENIERIKTFVSVKLISSESQKKILYEQINIEVPSSKFNEVVPLILPHILPDLPIYLLWADDPTKTHDLFNPLKVLSDRLIFQSDCCNNLQEFAKKVCSEVLHMAWEVADLNWIRLEGWRNVIKGIFNTEKRFNHLKNAEKITLYFTKDNPSSCHNHLPHYFHGWLAAQLGWTPVSCTSNEHSKKMIYKSDHSIEIEIETKDPIEGIEPGSLFFIEIKTTTKLKFSFHLNPKDYLIQVEILDEQKPSEPYNAFLMHTKWKTALAREICYQETSSHYCNMLSILSQIQGLA